MPAEHRPDPIQPEPSQLVEAALLLGFASSTSHHPRLANAAAIRALSLVGNEVMLDLIDRCEVQMRAVATDLGVEFPR